MKATDFTNAIAIVSKYHTTEIVINQPINNFVGTLGTEKFTIHIKKCVPACTKALFEAGYWLSMTEYGLLVDKL